MEFLSEIEKEEVSLIYEEITSEVYNAIIVVHNEFILNNAFSEAFPFNDGGYGVTNCDKSALEVGIKANVPNIKMPLISVGVSETIDKYVVLDLIKYLYNNISDPYIHSEHPEYPLNIYKFRDKGTYKNKFRNKINTILRRNRIVFYISDEGVVKRKIPQYFNHLFRQDFNTGDIRINSLLNIAVTKFSDIKHNERMIGLQNLWQAFERLKSLLDKDKKKSSEILVEKISDSNKEFKRVINDEFKNLTKYGNSFQIRHFEKTKIEIANISHLDYFFYRMMALINLSINMAFK